MDEQIAEVLEKAWQGGFKTKSNFARKRANEVGVCASLGLITTKIKGFSFGTTWYITEKGIGTYHECFQRES